MFYRSRPVYRLFGAKMPGRKAINPPRNAIRRIRHASNDCERAY
ncbi:hypothetical protein A676_02600 [Salmonella enterica subsp. enterica serovar Enteritidis str. 2010K-0262]|uniref:Uncharacterized protein n=1 Tax=Salmonella enterica subsp. enterica serovar Cubana str. 76814 TaxID=1192560 RepID=V7IXR9_SALET|nr:hypothetical protein A671_04216 [Salmonella enterica subsp. enterica serovar Dublin str. DG22]EPI66273.1 hypothetical protein A672_04077 [Salmonella enterica subsp. enterica serovar Enteritidis str. 08-1080]EPI82333.1 hypothetical protein A676_02600 [Salmonella enterica subsp. enterica serovar Enteritidis str. 2010K-0262]EPI92615.1 hypothetical protein A675_00398 [Salmonella enterica subsp. enterica serovar Enteritidis str. 2009K1726]EPJ05068.1 hypothetical protein A679_00982 [Salmonella ent